MKKIKAILFDLDGTLLDTIDDIADSANYTLERFGYPTHPVDAYRYFVGQGADYLLSAIVPEDARVPWNMSSLKKVYIERYNAHSLDKTRPYDGIVEAVKKLREAGLKLAVISNKPDQATKDTVSSTFPEGLFDFLAGARPDVPLKPDPTIVHIVLDKFGISPEEAFFAGDTIVDLATAKNARCPSIGVTWGFRPEEVTGADFVIDDPSELPGLAAGRE
ncbi:MAG: HAD-IA family hydrolase [Synergistaceae bacterium]|jgi:phosphoglycolate phosphatase|nr:HAD-IA family hydrolase [Synergistaceae bacterium]